MVSTERDYRGATNALLNLHSFIQNACMHMSEENPLPLRYPYLPYKHEPVVSSPATQYFF